MLDYIADGPVPLAGSIDQSEGMTGMLRAFAGQLVVGSEGLKPGEALLLVKTTMVFAVNIGIRIGEGRRKLPSDYSYREDMGR